MTATDEAALAGRYQLGERLGTGGVADVYRAIDPVLDRPVAVKVFRYDAEACDARRIESEMHTLAGLEHPGLVRLYDAGVSDRLPYLVMELVPGPTLAQRLAEGPLPPSEIAAIGSQLAAALDYVHNQGIVHRDVKPANILLADPTVKLADFGIARLVDSPSITEHGTTVGTANYLSPEQVAGRAAEPASDVHALGLVLLECFTGRMAYPGPGVEAALARLHQPPAIPTSLGPPWTDLLTRMTATDPAARPAAREVADTLSSLAAEPAGAALPDSVAAEPPQTPTLASEPTLPPTRPHLMRALRRRRGLAVGAATAVGAVVALMLALTGGHHARANPSAPPAYPTVAGRLGTHLRQLEQAIEPAGTGAGEQLRHDVLALATAAGRHDYAAAATAADELNADVAAARAANVLPATQVARIRAALGAVRADLAAADASPAPTATVTVTSSPDPAPQPVRPTVVTAVTSPPGAPSPRDGPGDKPSGHKPGHGKKPH